MNHINVFRVHFEKEAERNLRIRVVEGDLDEFKKRVVKGARETNGWRGAVGEVVVSKDIRPKVTKTKNEAGEDVVTTENVEKNVYNGWVDFTCFPRKYKNGDTARAEAEGFIAVLTTGAKYGGRWKVLRWEELPDTTPFEIDEDELPVYEEKPRKPRTVKPKEEVLAAPVEETTVV